MVTSSALPLSLLVCLSCFWVALTDIIPYKDDIIYPQHPAYLSVPKFAPKDAPDWSPGNGNSYIGRSQWIFCPTRSRLIISICCHMLPNALCWRKWILKFLCLCENDHYHVSYIIFLFNVWIGFSLFRYQSLSSLKLQDGYNFVCLLCFQLSYLCFSRTFSCCLVL